MKTTNSWQSLAYSPLGAVIAITNETHLLITTLPSSSPAPYWTYSL